MGTVDLGMTDLVALDAGRWALNQVAHDMSTRGLHLSSRELYECSETLKQLAERASEAGP